MGMNVGDLTPAAVAQRKLKVTEGAIIVSVVPGGPAEKAGVQSNDVIVAIDGQPVKVTRDFAETLASGSNSTVELKLNRAGSELEVHVELPK